MKLFGREMEGRKKALVILVAVLLVSAGLCGLQLTMTNKIYNSSGTFGPIMILLGVLELIAMFVSLIGIAVVLVNILVTRLFELQLSGSNRTERVFHVSSQMDEPQDRSSGDSRGIDEDTTR